MKQGQDTTDGKQQPSNEYDVYVEADRITFVKKSPAGEDHTKSGKSLSLSSVLSLLLLLTFLFLPSSAASAALPTVTITIYPKMEQITTTQNVQLPARLLVPLTLSESKTIPTTGIGHQNATQARGSITFYNGLFTSQTIVAGTILTASDGEHILTDQTASIPAANPPGLGQTSILAHAIDTGVQGNIPAYTINQLCCATAVKAVNMTTFTGGADQRYFKVVTQHDIDGVSQPLTKTLIASILAALSAQLTTAEALIPPLCSEHVSPDHRVGDEAVQVQVTVLETCSAGAYDKQTLQELARQGGSKKVAQTLGNGYTLLGDIQYEIHSATFQQGRATLSVTCSGVWLYQLSSKEQQRLVHVIAGKRKLDAILLLLSESGIQEASITGTDNAILPTDTSRIHMLILHKGL